VLLPDAMSGGLQDAFLAVGAAGQPPPFAADAEAAAEAAAAEAEAAAARAAATAGAP
jgi:hypothetical protein